MPHGRIGWFCTSDEGAERFIKLIRFVLATPGRAEKDGGAVAVQAHDVGQFIAIRAAAGFFGAGPSWALPVRSMAAMIPRGAAGLWPARRSG